MVVGVVGVANDLDHQCPCGSWRTYSVFEGMVCYLAPSRVRSRVGAGGRGMWKVVLVFSVWRLPVQ